MDARFPPAKRLRARHEFKAVQERGRRVTTKYMTLLAQPNESKHDRLGIIASRRLGDAVRRNRAKRRLRAVFRQTTAPHAADARTLDIVVIPRRELVDAPFGQLQAEFENALRRLRGRR